MMDENIKIIVEGGDVFEGYAEHWRNTFFDNVSIELIKDFCEREGWKVEFI